MVRFRMCREVVNSGPHIYNHQVGVHILSWSLNSHHKLYKIVIVLLSHNYTSIANVQSVLTNSDNMCMRVTWL